MAVTLETLVALAAIPDVEREVLVDIGLLGMTQSEIARRDGVFQWRPEVTTPGLCLCGCGGRTKIATKNDAWFGYVKGQPRRFLDGHHYPSASAATLIARVREKYGKTLCAALAASSPEYVNHPASPAPRTRRVLDVQERRGVRALIDAATRARLEGRAA